MVEEQRRALPRGFSRGMPLLGQSSESKNKSLPQVLLYSFSVEKSFHFARSRRKCIYTCIYEEPHFILLGQCIPSVIEYLE